MGGANIGGGDYAALPALPAKAGCRNVKVHHWLYGETREYGLLKVGGSIYGLYRDFLGIIENGNYYLGLRV